MSGMRHGRAWWVSLALAAGLQAEESKAPMAMEGRASTSGALHVFEGEVRPGTADGETVRMRVYFVRRWEIPVGLRDPGGPTHDEELVEIDRGTASVTDGVARVTCGYSDLEHWPGDYRILAWWGDAVAGEVEQATALKDFAVGDPARIPELKRQADRELYEDFARIDRVLTQFAERWNGLGDGPDEGWPEWRAAAERTIAKVKERNAKRRKADVYWPEARGRQRIEWALERVPPLLQAGALSMTVPRAGRPDPADVAGLLEEAVGDLRHYMQFMEIGRIIDDGKVRRLLLEIEGLVAPLAEWREKAAADPAAWRVEAARLRVVLFQCQMALNSELSEAYFSRAEAVQKAFMKLVAAVDARAARTSEPGDWDALVKSLAEACEALRSSVPPLPRD